MKSARYVFLALFLLATDRAAAQDVAAPASPPQQVPAEAVPDTTRGTSPVAGEASTAESPVAGEASATQSPSTGDQERTAEDGTSPASATPSEAAATEPDAEGPARLTDAELAALGLSMEKQGLDTDLHISGFMDVGYTQLLNPKEAPFGTRTNPDEASFFVGRLNLYLTKNITESFRMMAEVRYMYAPNGATPLVNTTGKATYTEVADPAGSGTSVRWGGVQIERAYGEWSPLSFLSLRLGAFLTPYGIWNVDHGSPVYIPVTRPYAVNGMFFPERQTGLEALGTVALSTDLAVRYHLTLSNGLGPVSEYRDLDSNKAIGGRLAFEYLALGTIQVGGSAFYGQDSSGSVGFGLNPDGTAVTYNKIIDAQSDVTALAADVLWKYRGLHLQGEWVGQRRQYTKAGRTLTQSAGQVGIPANALVPDTFNWACYGLVGYRLPWWGIMPYLTLEYQNANYWGILTRTNYGRVGLNIRPKDAVVLKAEYQHVYGGTEQTRTKVVSAQVAWAF